MKKTGLKINEDIRKKQIVADIKSDFESRREERRPYELAWLLNINFLIGNQYSYISTRGEIEKMDKNFGWESRDVFNHIAPIIESRLAKLARVRPTMSVMPSGGEEGDVEVAKLSKSILNSVAGDKKLSDKVSLATVWSEVTGSCFYKVFWNENGGTSIPLSSEQYEKLVENIEKSGINKSKYFKTAKNGEMSISPGDVDIEVVSPFEIFPESSACSGFESMQSVIHAYPISAMEAEKLYGMPFVGSDISMLSLESTGDSIFSGSHYNAIRSASIVKHNQVLVIEKYIAPCEDYPSGRLLIVAGDELVYEGKLPLACFPFIRQVSSETLGSFWGTSIIDRCIPIQRAYNNLKNRKYEFFARLSSGVLAVEDGSVDVDNLEDEGLAPGKILVYRAGASIPKFMDAGDIPSEFNQEEDRLLNEFITLTGVSELMRNSSLPTSVTSGTAINLLIEQDDTRLSVPAENIRRAYLAIGKRVLELYKEYADYPKLAKVASDNGDIEFFYWNKTDISSSDVVLDTTNELSETPAQRKNMVLELLKNGLLYDENGRLDRRTKAKVFEALGFGNFESTQDILSLHIKKADRENIKLAPLMVSEIDDHDIHIEEHTKFLLSDDAGKLTDEEKDNFIQHIREHKRFSKLNEE